MDETKNEKLIRILKYGPRDPSDYEIVRYLKEKGYTESPIETSYSKDAYNSVNNIIWIGLNSAGNDFLEKLEASKNENLPTKQHVIEDSLIKTENKMKMFISWSGPRSEQMAEFLKDWLGDIFQSLEIFFSGDIQKGKGWHTSIISELESCDMGMFLLTRKNLDAQWLNYEAGAIAKQFTKSNIFTLLIDDKLDPGSLGPLSHFQATHMDEHDIKKLMYSINSCLNNYSLNDAKLTNALSKWMPDFWKKWEGIKQIPLELPYVDSRSVDEKLDDILGRINATNLNFHNVIDQINIITKVVNAKLSENIPLIEKKYAKNNKEQGMKFGLKKIILPDGSTIGNMKLPEGGSFNTWEAYGIAIGKSQSEINALKAKDNEKGR